MNIVNAKIINYDPQYAQKIVQLWRASKRHALGDYIEPHDEPDMLNYLTQTMAIQDNLYLATETTRLLGFMALKDNWINQLYISIQHLDQGIGSQFMAIAKQKSPQFLQVYTFECNLPARAFYRKHGFTETQFGTQNEENLPDILLQWQI